MQQNRMLSASEAERVDTNFSWLVPCRPQVHLFRYLGKCFAYDANSRVSFEVTDDVYDLMVAAQEDIVDEDSAKRFILSLPVADPVKQDMMRWLFSAKEPMVALSSFKTYRGGPSQLLLSVTNACNLNCAYCFTQFGYEDRCSFMPRDVIEKAVRFMDSRSKWLSLFFFGGEPMLNKEAIIYATAAALGKAEALRAKLKPGITTNLTILEDDMVKLMKEHRFGVMVSLDGDKEIQDAQRDSTTLGSTYDLTIGNLEKLAHGRRTCHVTLRGTLLGTGFDLVKVLNHHESLCERGLADGISFYPVESDVEGKYDFGEDLSWIDTEIEKAVKWYLRRAVRGKHVSWGRLKRHMATTLYCTIKTYFCNAGFRYLSVGPSGTIFACHRQGASAIGHVDYGVDERRRVPWVDDRVYAIPECSQCWMRFACGGICRAHSLTKYGNAVTPDRAHCYIAKRLFEGAVWMLSEVGQERALRFVRRPSLSVAESRRRQKRQAQRNRKHEGKG